MVATVKAPKRLVDIAKPWVVKALKELSPDEHVIWELSITAFPDPSDVSDESTGFVPVLIVYLEIEGPSPLTSMYASPLMQPYKLTEDRIKEAVRITLESMRKMRAEKQAEPEEEEIPAPALDPTPEDLLELLRS